jgi:hypothetical protein
MSNLILWQEGAAGWCGKVKVVSVCEYQESDTADPTAGRGGALHYAPPDFLSNLLALAILMRLSLRKGAIRDPCEFCVLGNPGTLRSKNIATKGPRNCRFLGFARDDKEEGERFQWELV